MKNMTLWYTHDLVQSEYELLVHLCSMQILKFGCEKYNNYDHDAVTSCECENISTWHCARTKYLQRCLGKLYDWEAS